MSQDATVSRNRLMSLRQAFEAEHARRAAERRAREEAEQAQQEADRTMAEQLRDRLAADAAFLAEKGLKLSMSATHLTVLLEHADYEIRAYVEGGAITLRSSDRRTATTPTAVPRKQTTVEAVDDAVLVIAQFLADETR
jgi:hypothetical protein